MKSRITSTVIVFAFPFHLDEVDEELPAGGYTVETEDEALDGATFTAHRWIETVLVIPPPSSMRRPIRFVEVDPFGLEAALLADRARSATALAAADRAAQDTATNEGMRCCPDA